MQRGGQLDSVLGIAEPVPDDRPRMIIQECEQVGFAARRRADRAERRRSTARSDERLEPAEHRRRDRSGAG